MLTLYTYRRYIWRNAVADLRHRYTGTGLGIFWNVLNPLMQIAIYAVVFTQIMRPQMPGSASPYQFVIYLCAGLLPWMAFAECVTRGTNSFVENATYLKKLPVPEAVFVAQAAVSATISLAISLLLLAGLSLVLGQVPTWHWLLLPLAVVLWQTFGFGLGLLLGTLNTFLRDIAPIVALALQLWMWTLPIVYLASILPRPVQSALAFNPPYGFLRAIQDLVVFGQMPPTWVWPAMAGWTGAAVLGGVLVLRALRAELRDVI